MHSAGIRPPRRGDLQDPSASSGRSAGSSGPCENARIGGPFTIPFPLLPIPHRNLQGRHPSSTPNVVTAQDVQPFHPHRVAYGNGTASNYPHRRAHFLPPLLQPPAHGIG